MKEYDATPKGYLVDEKTLGYYSDQAEALLSSAVEERPVYIDILRDLLEEGAAILDVGAGLGRDVHLLSEEGFEVRGIEPNRELIARGQRHFRIPENRLKAGSLPDLKGVGDRQYDAVLCALVLHHLPDTALLDALYTLKQQLSDGGLLLITVPTKAPEGTGDVPYTIRSPEQYQFFFTRLGLDLIRELDLVPSVDPTATQSRLMLFAARKTEGGLRPIETLESILIEDRKVNSYKYALLRALANLATRRYNAVDWRTDGTVSLHIDLIAREWIEQYWPIIAAEREKNLFVLQGQKIKNKSDVTFREPLRELVDIFREGGLNAFVLALESSTLSASAQSLYRATLNKVRSGIEQPVQYAGNKRTGEKVFRREGRQIVMPAELWTELSVMGRWVADSIVLRWAEFTENLKHQTPGLTKEQILSLLLQQVETDRRVARAREAYDRVLTTAGFLECAWSGAEIRTFDVDHAIPFALWGNNDLWNLLPAAPKVNSAKRAKLPSRALVEHRRGSIMHAWEQLYEAESALFLHHAGEFIGQELTEFGARDRATLFSTFKDAIEYTAQNRVAERWDGEEMP